MKSRIWSFAGAILLLALAGCQSGPSPTLDMFKAIWGGSGGSGAGLDPRLAYLRVTAKGRAAFVLLGYVEPHPQGPVEVWYSGELETLRLQNGRLVGLSGSSGEWHGVRLPELPSWTDLLAHEGAFRWQRQRDVMPGYRFNLRDELQLRAIAPPRQSALVGLDGAGLRWFEERMITTSIPSETLPPARYALQVSPGGAEVVYAEQCVTPDFCLTWQRWKPQP